MTARKAAILRHADEQETMTTCVDIDTWQAGQGPDPPGGGYTIKGTPFEGYWTDLPSLWSNSATDKTTLVVQGHSFWGRMAVLKYLMYNDDSLWGENHEWHWLWGYASQLDWQHRSGRLAIGRQGTSDDDDEDVISTQSWWNYMNFCFSVCILLGAERGGVLVGVKRIQLDEASQDFVTNDCAIQKCIASWQHLFETAYGVYAENVKGVDISSKDFGSARFALQQNVWIAHTSVIQYTIGEDSSNINTMSPRAAELLQLLPIPERNFGLGWCRMVEIIAACTFPTDLVSLLQDGAGFLPLRVVTEKQIKEWQSSRDLQDPDSRRFNSVEVTHKLLKASAASLHRMAAFWQRVVCSNDISRAMPTTIKQLANGMFHEKLHQMSRIMYLYARPRGMLEWSILIAFLSTWALVMMPVKKQVTSK